jgi:hypothetical protein
MGPELETLLSGISGRVTSSKCFNLSSTKKSRTAWRNKSLLQVCSSYHTLSDCQRRTRQQTGHLTALKSIGMSLLYFAVDHLHIEEMASYKDLEKGKSRLK